VVTDGAVVVTCGGAVVGAVDGTAVEGGAVPGVTVLVAAEPGGAVVVEPELLDLELQPATATTNASPATPSLH
jgi:hypothetical protein